MRKLTAAQVAYFLPRDWRNPISGCTVDEEREIALGIGGRLPHIAYIAAQINLAKSKRNPAVNNAIKLASEQNFFSARI